MDSRFQISIGDGDTRSGLSYDPTIVGETGLNQFGGYVTEEFLNELAGERGKNIYREMADNDPVVGAVLFAVNQLIRNVEWTVQGVDDSPESDAAKAFVEEVLDDMTTPLEDVIDEISTMFVYGFAPLEIVWKVRNGTGGKDGSRRSRYTDGRIGLRALSLRGQRTVLRWLIDEDDGSIDGLEQTLMKGGTVCIPIEKLLLFRTTTAKNNPEGRSMLRNAYRPWFLKKHIENIEAIGVERDLAGLPVVRVPGTMFRPDATPDERAALANWKTLVTRIKRDKSEGVVMPSSRDQNGNYLFDINLLSTAGSRQLDTTRILERYDRAIATTVLADFIFLGQTAVGSFALSSDKTALFGTAVGGYLKNIAGVFNTHLLPRLWRLNGLPDEFMPTMVPGDIEKPDIEALSAYLRDLTGAGMQVFPDREIENHLLNAAGLPMKPEDGSDTGEGFNAPPVPGAGGDDDE